MAENSRPQWQNRIVRRGQVHPRDVLLNPHNWRAHPQAQQDAMLATYRELGQVQAILINEPTGLLIDGHLRVALAILDSQESIEAVWVDLSAAEEAAALLLFDAIGAMAKVNHDNYEILREMQGSRDATLLALIEQNAIRFGLAATGRQASRDAGPQMDRAEELQRKWSTETGQTWELPSLQAHGGVHRLRCGSSTNPSDLAELMGDERAMVIFTDPPYGIGYVGGMRVRERLSGDTDASMYDAFLPLLDAVAIPEAALYLWHSDAFEQSGAVIAAMRHSGWIGHAHIVWSKNNAQYSNFNMLYKPKHECCWLAWRDGQRPYWAGSNSEVTVWDVSRAAKNLFHPTQKPPALAERALVNSTRPGDLVVDPFAGGGSTMVAAEQTGRVAYCQELSPLYVAVILERMADMGLVPEQVTKQVAA